MCTGHWGPLLPSTDSGGPQWARRRDRAAEASAWCRVRQTPGVPDRPLPLADVAFAPNTCSDRPSRAAGGVSVRVLGVDPGLTRCGVGVVDGAAGRPLQLVDVGVVRTGSDVPLAYRLLAIERALERWVAATQPDVIAVERVFSQQNVRTVMGTAQASAVALLVAARCGIAVAMHTPSEVKAAVSGNGRADKAQVGAMVVHLLRLEAAPTPADATDALALARDA